MDKMTDPHAEADWLRGLAAYPVELRQETRDRLHSIADMIEAMANTEAIAAWNTREALSAVPQEDQVERLREALEECRDFLKTAPLESGYCCCGSPVEGHGFDDGHSPVDDLQYTASNLVEKIDAALASPVGDGLPLPDRALGV